MVQLRDAFGQTQLRKLMPVRAKCVRFNNLSTSLDVGLMNPEHRFGVCRIQFVDRPLLTNRIVQTASP